MRLAAQQSQRAERAQKGHQGMVSNLRSGFIVRAHFGSIAFRLSRDVITGQESKSTLASVRSKPLSVFSGQSFLGAVVVGLWRRAFLQVVFRTPAAPKIKPNQWTRGQIHAKTRQQDPGRIK